MRLTKELFYYKINKVKWLKTVWKTRGKYKNPPLQVPEAIEKLGVNIVDPLEEFRTDIKKEWKPPANDPRFYEEPSPTENPLYKENPVTCYSYNIKFLQNIDQVCVLTKTQNFDGLPQNVSDLVNKIEIPNKEKLLKRYIIHSQDWVSKKVKLPRRIDKENLKFKFPREYGIPPSQSIGIFLTDLLRMCQSTAAQFPNAVKGRRLIHSPFINTHYMFNDKNILIRGSPSYMLGSNQDLQPFANQEIIDKSIDMPLPDLYPVEPTIDLIKEHFYNDSTCNGFKLPYAFNRPHTLFMQNSDHWNNVDRQCRSLMFCFAYATARARERFGEDVVKLPEPVSVQCVNMDQTTLNFTCFQLNTLDINTEGGVKNFVWFDTGNQIFKKILPQPWKEDEYFHKKRYGEFESTPLDKMLALVLNGLPETANL
ncbi:large ribosomal subunit protein mL37-like [Mytilus edulis]|uniref:large ribosomal subunit protein mL37-like n=1 Tax=Mytilus edulis TaxID=6550 RepID=UPI0039EE609F